jgi:hypothetical protein
MPRQMISSKSLSGFYARDLARKKWQFAATLGFRSRSVPFWMANRMFQAWIFEIEGGDDSADGSRWFRVNAFGAFPDKPLFHVLVRELETISKYRLKASWQEIAGDAEIKYFYPDVNAFAFIADIARSGTKFEIDSDLG